MMMHWLGSAVALLSAVPALAQAAPRDDAAPPERWALHGQVTLVAQAVPGFPAPYAGPNSLQPREVRETIDATLFAGFRPWPGAELWANPEVDQGHGLSDTLGAAAYPNAEAFKIGHDLPHLRLHRLFLRQTIALGDEWQAADADENRLAGSEPIDRLLLTLGKFAVGDVFDANAYAHDPRRDFLNLSLVDTGSLDLASDAWGYTVGATAEWTRRDWSVRLGLFALSREPGGTRLDAGFGQYQLDAEIEHRHRIDGRPGAVRLTAFRNRGRFARYDEAMAWGDANGLPADGAPVRRAMTRIGFGLSAEQEISDALGVFVRAGIADGAIEPYDFTDVDRTFAIGGALAGTAWARAADRVGLAVAVNGISGAHRRFLQSGGLGLLVGDGQLPHAGAEIAAETYYAWDVAGKATVSVDYQLLANPGYNRDRGSAHVIGLRIHGEW